MDRREFVKTSGMAGLATLFFPLAKSNAIAEEVVRELKVGDIVRAEFVNKLPLSGEIVGININDVPNRARAEKECPELLAWTDENYPDWDKDMVSIKLSEDWLVFTKEEYQKLMDTMYELNKSPYYRLASAMYSPGLMTRKAGTISLIPKDCVSQILGDEAHV